MRVVDLTDLRGALCARILADLGADVIRVEHEEPDDSLHALARYVLETPDLAAARPDRAAALAEAFRHLKRGWPHL